MDDYLDPCIFIFEIMSDEDEFMNIEQTSCFHYSFHPKSLTDRVTSR
jgi:hypothetical protein